MIQSAPLPLLSRKILDMGVNCALLALYSQLIDHICIQSIDGLYLWQFGNVMKKMELVIESPCTTSHEDISESLR